MRSLLHASRQYHRRPAPPRGGAVAALSDSGGVLLQTPPARQLKASLEVWEEVQGARAEGSERGVLGTCFPLPQRADPAPAPSLASDPAD